MQNTLDFDVIIVGASFSGLTLAHHIPSTLRVLVVDAKPTAGATVESTGLITVKTREEFRSFFPIDEYITNPINAICVVAPNFSDHFISRTSEPWIYQTDTKGLIRRLADSLPANVILRTSTVFVGVDNPEQVTAVVLQNAKGERESVSTRFLVGADGGRSKVASVVSGLDQNTKFLFGYEQVFFGNVHLGPQPAETIYHYWFGEFSLGYGGWLSPTIVNGRNAFRIGLAKLMKDRGDAKQLMDKFLKTLLDRGVITVDGDVTKPDYVFGSMIPIGGALKRISNKNVLLIGDAAGFCGAFAADGIKGSVVSAKEAAKLIPRYLTGELDATKELSLAIERHGGLLGYYKRQTRYRMIWDLMKRNRTFTAMYRIIESEKDSFLDQFCDSKDKHTSLSWVVLKWRHVPALVRYAFFIVSDFFER
ncbi:NAD(P)/FAD-dependent oxidoreductase [Patescibacteria group bacterium]|nr:NAD(P)/FAD-dependent oxidoreductase [Patescibacteria group bacterium]